MARQVQRMADVNGEITPLDQARISILDRGFLYGDSVYEVFRTYSGVPLCCHEHFEFYSRGMRLAVTRVRRNPVEALSPDIKSGNYLNNILALAPGSYARVPATVIRWDLARFSARRRRCHAVRCQGI